VKTFDGVSLPGLAPFGGRAALRRLARRYGTPLYVYSAKTLRERFETLRRAFAGQDVLFCYALKANSNRSVAGILARAGAGADIVSGGELLRALRAGFRPEEIVFSGVGKTREEMAAGLRRGILAFHVESGEELAALEAVAKRLKKRARFSVRVNPDVKADTHHHITTGTAENKFGVEAPEARALYERALGSRWLEPVGIQCHLGSQIVDPAPYGRALDHLLRIVDRLAAKGADFRYVDIGGGMGIPYASGGKMGIERFSRTLRKRMRDRPLTLVLEPGRWLVGPAGILLTETLYRKRTSARNFVVVDAGMNDLVRPALYDAEHTVAAVTPRRGRKERFDLVGPVCETADRFVKGLIMRSPEPGDLLAIGQAGAYGATMASTYNSRPLPAEVLIEGGRARLVRRRGRIEDLAKDER
jgi:diaminopimelate decarboxylase